MSKEILYLICCYTESGMGSPLTVTTSLTINFLRKPSAEARIIAECSLLKVGRTLIVGEVSLYSEGSSDLVAHVVGTYSVPPKHD